MEAVLQNVPRRQVVVPMQAAASAVAPGAVTDAVGQRDVAGCYPADQRGKLARDGSRLDEILGDHVIARAWRDSACDVHRCFRPEVARMVPRQYRACYRHPRQKLPDVDPYPLDGPESDRAEDDAWEMLAPRYGILERDRWASFAKATPTPALSAAQAFIDAYHKDECCCALGIAGGVGCGKTTALACVVRELAVWSGPLASPRHPAVTLFYPFSTLIRLLLDPAARDATLKACREADHLIVDDWGSSYVKADGMVVGLLEEIIIHREGQLADLLFSTNLSTGQFRKSFGERVYDRLAGEWGRWVSVSGPSLRRKRGAGA